MRKFSKILTVLLTLALLCGVILSVFASAAEGESREALNVSGASHNQYTDFESTNNGYISGYFPWKDGATVENTAYTFEDASDGNTYFRFATLGYDGTKTGKREAWLRFADYGWPYHRNGLHNIGAHDYVTIDFEIGTDKYKYQDAEGAWYMVDKLEDIPAAYRPAAGEEYRALALHNGLDININARAAQTLSGTNNGSEIHQYLHFFLVQDSVSGKWYLADKNTYDAATVKVELSNKIGEFDHITWVIKTERSNVNENCDLGYDLKGTKAYSFVNGEYFIESSFPGGYDSIVPNTIRFINPNQYQNSISICFDNVAINWYGYREVTQTTTGEGESATTTYAYSNLGTVYSSKGYGIDDYITSGDYKTLGLWNCEDVVYGADYVNPNGKTSIGAEIDALDNYDTLTINKSYENVVVPGRILAFTVVAENGAKFALAPESLARYNVAESVDGTTTTYTVTAKESVFVNDNYAVMSGTSINRGDNFNTTSGKWTAYRSSAVGKEIVAGANGNKYMRVTIAKTGLTDEVATVNAQFGPADNGKYADYKYTTIDIDLAVDGYVYSWKETINDVEVTKYSTSLDDIPEGVTPTKGDLAYPTGFYYYLRATSGGANPANSGLLNVNIKKDADTGLYYAARVKSNVDVGKVYLSNEVGVFDHYSFVLRMNYDENGAPVSVDCFCYVNGEFLYQENSTACLTSPYLQKLTMTYYWDGAVSAINKCYPAPEGDTTGNIANIKAHLHEFADKYAMGFDNYALNYYSANSYNSQYLDAFFGEDFDATAKLFECDGAVYNSNYVDPNGIVFSMDGGKTYVHNISTINSALAGLKTGDSIITNRNILNFTPAEGVENFTVKLVGDAEFTLSEEAISALWILTTEGDTISAVKYSKSDAIAFNFVDGSGKTFYTEYLLPGMSLNTAHASEIAKNLYNTATATVSHVSAWKINGADAEGYKVTTLAGPKTVTVTPTIEVDGTLSTYAIYYTDDNGLVKLSGGFASYPAAMTDVYDAAITLPGNVMSDTAFTALQNLVSAAPNGATLMLLYTGTLDIGGGRSIAIPANREISIDLNGKTLIHSYNPGTAYGAKMFRLYEGATVNLYSSVENGTIYQARYQDNYQSSYVFAQGIFYTEGIHSATINIEGENVRLIGGSVVYFNGNAETRKAENVDDRHLTININGGYYYHSLRSGYGMFTTACPDVYINIDGGTFINTNHHYGIFHDYTNAGFNSTTHVNAKNAEFICMNDAGDTLYSFTGTIGFKDFSDVSELYFENCNIIGKVGDVNSGSSITFGKNCNVAGVEFKSGVATADDVDFAYGSDYKLTVTYPFLFVSMAEDSGYTIKPMGKNEAGMYYLNPVFYNVPARSWGTKDKVWGMYFTTTPALVSAAKTVTWYDLAGETLATQKWLDGSTLTHIPAIESVDLDWYDVVYVWDTDKVVGDTAVNPVATVGGNDIKTKYANVTLTSGMTLNIYLPKVEGIVVTGVKVGDADLEVSEVTINVNDEDIACYVFSWDSAAASFDSAVATVSFTVTDADYNFAAAAGSAEVKLDVVRYATLVSGSFGHESEEANLVLEMMNYKEAVAALLNSEYVRNEATEAFYALHKDCACGVDIQIDAEKEVANTEALKAAGITGATFDMDDLGVISMILNSEKADLSVGVTYYDGINVQTVDVEYNEELKAYVAKDIPAAYIDNIMSITVGEVSGQYCLAAYIQSIPTIEGLDEATRAKVTNVATALYEYAMAAEAYKHVTKAEAAQ